MSKNLKDNPNYKYENGCAAPVVIILLVFIYIFIR